MKLGTVDESSSSSGDRIVMSEVAILPPSFSSSSGAFYLTLIELAGQKKSMTVTNYQYSNEFNILFYISSINVGSDVDDSKRGCACLC